VTEVTSRTTKVLVSTIVAVRTFSSVSSYLANKIVVVLEGLECRSTYQADH